MKLLRKMLAASVAVGGAAVVSAGTASAASATDIHAAHAVFVETDNLAGNQVASYIRNGDGALTPFALYQTEGLGGQLNGAVVDHQASQGALGYDRTDQLLFATNAGSNTVSVFSVQGPDLELQQVVSSGGQFPVSVTQNGDLVYVLNARGGGSVSGFRIDGNRLHPIPGSTVALGFTPVTDSTEFTHTPGQVAFSPDGTQLLVTTKALGQSVMVFHVRASGALDANPVVNPIGNVPFAVSFRTPNQLLLVEAAGNVATLNLDPFGNLHPVDSLPTNQTASCWIVRSGHTWYVSNAGSATLSGFSAARGILTDLGNTSTDPGTVDAAASFNAPFVYVQGGLNGTVDSFQVGATGTLSPVGGAITVPGAAGGEGIAAS